MSFNTDQALTTNQLPISVDFSKEFNDFLREMNLLYRRIANTVNTKSGGLYSSVEYGSSEQLNVVIDPVTKQSTFQNVYRKCFNMVVLNSGNIGLGATASFDHNIDGLKDGIAYAWATNSDSVLSGGPKRMFLPYSSQTNTKCIECFINDKKVVVINGSTQTPLTYCVLIAEYVKN